MFSSFEELYYINNAYLVTGNNNQNYASYNRICSYFDYLLTGHYRGYCVAFPSSASLTITNFDDSDEDLIKLVVKPSTGTKNSGTFYSPNSISLAHDYYSQFSTSTSTSVTYTFYVNPKDNTKFHITEGTVVNFGDFTNASKYIDYVNYKEVLYNPDTYLDFKECKSEGGACELQTVVLSDSQLSEFITPLSLISAMFLACMVLYFIKSIIQNFRKENK